MNIDELTTYLNSFARENSFLSIILIAIIANLLYDITKKTFRYIFYYTIKLIKNSGKKITEQTYKNIQNLIDYYTNEINSVKNIKEYNQKELLSLLESLYTNILYLIAFAVLYFTMKLMDSPYWFYGLLGASSTMLFNTFYTIYNNTRLFEKAKNFNSYKLMMEKRINKLNQLLANKTTKTN